MFLTIAEKCSNIETVECLKHYKLKAIMSLWSFHLGVLQETIGLEQHGIMDILCLSAASQLS